MPRPPSHITLPALMATMTIQAIGAPAPSPAPSREITDLGGAASAWRFGPFHRFNILPVRQGTGPFIPSAAALNAVVENNNTSSTSKMSVPVLPLAPGPVLPAAASSLGAELAAELRLGPGPYIPDAAAMPAVFEGRSVAVSAAPTPVLPLAPGLVLPVSSATEHLPELPLGPGAYIPDAAAMPAVFTEGGVSASPPVLPLAPGPVLPASSPSAEAPIDLPLAPGPFIPSSTAIPAVFNSSVPGNGSVATHSFQKRDCMLQCKYKFRWLWTDFYFSGDGCNVEDDHGHSLWKVFREDSLFSRWKMHIPGEHGHQFSGFFSDLPFDQKHIEHFMTNWAGRQVTCLDVEWPKCYEVDSCPMNGGLTGPPGPNIDLT